MAVEIINIVDCSGSMGPLKSDAIGAFNTFVEEQKKQPGEANITTVLFENTSKTMEYRVALEGATMFTNDNYVPGGGTALNDAIGDTITQFRKLHDDGILKADGVVVSVLTDGYENTSRKYTTAQIKTMINAAEEELGWRFIYLAANQDAFAVGGKYGFDAVNTMNFASTGEGVLRAKNFMSTNVSQYRSSVGGSNSK